MIRIQPREGFSGVGADVDLRRLHGIGRVALGREVVDRADDDDYTDYRLEDWDIADRGWDRDVRQCADRGILVPGCEVARPQEVDLHRDAPDKPEDINDRAPAAELEWSVFLRPALEARAQDGDVSQDVREVD